MEAGRELNREIAMHVMGWEYLDALGMFLDEKGQRQTETPNYSTDVADAWQVLNKLIESGAEVNVGFYEQWDCSIDFPIGCNWTAQAETAPLAICLASLMAVGVEV